MTSPSSGVPAPPVVSDIDLRAWFAVRVRSQFEQIVSSALRARDIEEFLPLVRVRRQWSDRVKEIDVPLFPGYVFCRFDPSRRVPVLACPGVVDVVPSCPGPHPAEEIDGSGALVASSLGVQPHPFLSSGEAVRIGHGPLAGVEGVVVEVKNRFRLVVSVSLLQRSVSVEIDRAWVSSVSQHETVARAALAGASKGNSPMIQTTRKSRMISLRLSDEEFEALRSLYTTHGARSVSEFVRDAMQRLIAEPGTGNVSLEVKVQEMDGKLHLLDDNVARLSRLIQSEPASQQGGLSESD